MRLLLQFELENERLDIQYRKAIISWIKKSIQIYDENLYLQLYKDKDPICKSFTFSPVLSNPKFSKDDIQLGNNSMKIIFSFYNYAYALHFYNAFNSQKEQEFPMFQNKMILKKINMLPEKEILTDQINIKMLSPLVCRNHDIVTKKDMFYCAEREEFQKYIRINIEKQMEAEGLKKELLEGFIIEPIHTKKVIIALYEKKVETTLGTFKLSGKRELLDYLYRAGMGSKKAMGFGLFDII